MKIPLIRWNTRTVNTEPSKSQDWACVTNINGTSNMDDDMFWSAWEHAEAAEMTVRLLLRSTSNSALRAYHGIDGAALINEAASDEMALELQEIILYQLWASANGGTFRYGTKPSTHTILTSGIAAQ